MKKYFWVALVLIGLLAVPAYSPAADAPKAQKQTATVKVANQDSDILYFGTQKPNGTVSKDDWDKFLQKDVTERFPDGLTTWDAQGQWKDKKGKIIKEKSYVLLIVHKSDAKSEKAIKEIVKIYKKRFDQESVMRVRAKAAVSF